MRILLLLCIFVIQASAFNWQSEIPTASFSEESAPGNNSNIRINGAITDNIVAGGWVKYANFDFGTNSNITKMWIDVSKATDGVSYFQIRTGSPTGPEIGSVQILSTGFWGTYRRYFLYLSEQVTGIQDLYFTFSGESGYLYNLRNFSFDSQGHFHKEDVVSSEFSTESHFNDDANIIKLPNQIQNIRDGNWVGYNRFDFGDGMKYLWIEAATPVAGATIKVHFDSINGPEIGTIDVAPTGSFTTFKPLGCKLSSTIAGIRTLYFKFSGPAGDLLAIQSFRFQRLAPDHKPAALSVDRKLPVLSSLEKTYAGTFTTESHVGDNTNVRALNGKIVSIKANNWVVYQNFDFGSGVNSVVFSAGSTTAGTIELRLQNAQGPLIGSVAITNTGHANAPLFFSSDLFQNVAGVQDLCLVFKGGSGYLFDIYHFGFQNLLSEPKSPGKIVLAKSFDQQSPQGSGSIAMNSDSITALNDGSWISFQGMNFAQDSEKITVYAGAPRKGGLIEVRLASPTGALVARIDVTHTGSLTYFRPFTASFSGKISGVHDLYLKFIDSHNDGNSFMGLSSFVVGRATATATTSLGEGNINVYPLVPGLAASPYYTYSIQKVSALNNAQKENATNWLSPFAWFTECVENVSTTPIAYYKQYIGGWSHTYCNIEMDPNTPIVVKITRNAVPGVPSGPISMANAYPAHKVESCEIINGDVYVTMRNPALVTIDIDGQLDTRDAPRALPEGWSDQAHPYTSKANGVHAVSIFANPFIEDKPDLNDPSVFQVQPGTLPPADGSWNTLYFLPGIHKFSVDQNGNERDWLHTDVHVPKDGKRYYIPGDALVYGNFNDLDDSKIDRNIKIYGHGTISGTKIRHFKDVVGGVAPGGNNKNLRMLSISTAQGCRFEGITIADPAEHGLYLIGGSSSDTPNEMKWLKNLSWRVNNDGAGMSGGTIEDCFFRHQDDALYVAGASVRRCVFWTDVNGTPFRSSFFNRGVIAHEDIVVEDCDVIYARGVFGFGSRANYGIIGPDTLNNFSSLAGGAFNTGQHIVFKDIRITDPRPVRNFFGVDQLSAIPDEIPGTIHAPVSGLRFENIESRYSQTWGYENHILARPETPMQFWYFDGFSIDGKLVDENLIADPTVFNTQNVANFVFRDASVALPVTYSLSTIADNGSVTLSPPGGIYSPGTVVQLTASPNTTYKFDGWSGAATGSTMTTSVIMDGSKTVTALFSKPGTNQTINTSGSYLILDYDSSGNTYLGDGTLRVSSDGTTAKKISAGVVKNDPNTVFSMSGGLITIDPGVTLVNGEFSKVVWTNNRSRMEIMGILDLWNGQTVRVDALSGTGAVVFGYPWTAGARELVVGVNHGSGTYSGSIAGTHSSGSFIRIIKNGTGIQTFDQLATQRPKEMVIYQGAINLHTNTNLSYLTNISGVGKVIKSGTGSLTLAGIVSHTGDMEVHNGTLVLPIPTFSLNSSIAIGLTGSTSATLHLPNGGTHIVAQLTIDGVPQAGEGIVYDALNTGGAITGNGKIQVGISTVSDYTLWGQSNGLVGEWDHDDDKDGRTNYEEYVFGSNPNHPSSSNTVSPSVNGNTITYKRRNKTLTQMEFSIWYSSTLHQSSWLKDTGAVEGTPVLQGDVETVPVTLSPSLMSNPKLFIQVRAE